MHLRRAAIMLFAAALITTPAFTGGGLFDTAQARQQTAANGDNGDNGDNGANSVNVGNGDNSNNIAAVWRARGGRPLVIAHRGGAGIFPENTLAAMRGSAMLGVDVLDMDARLTKDGVLVAFHDKTLQRTTNGDGEVGNFDYQQLSMLNAAANFRAPDGKRHPAEVIPRIRDIMGEFADTRLLFVVEIKNQGEDGKDAARKLAAIVSEFDLQGRVIVGSFGGAPLVEYRKALPDAATSASQSEAAGVILLGGLTAPPIAALQIPPSFAGLDLAKKSRINDWQSRGYAVHYWTINDAAVMTQLVNDGADGIFSDYPDMLRDVLTKAGHPPPPGITTTANPPPK